MRVHVIAAVLLAALTVPAFGQDTVTVDKAEGYGTTKGEALKDAMRKAVEQGCGAYISSKSKTENFVLVSDQVYSESRGFVTKYEELSSTQNRDSTWTVVIKAIVNKKLIGETVEAYETMMDRVGRPKIMVVLKTVRNDKPIKSSEVWDALTHPLIEAQFEMVDLETLQENKKRDLDVAVLKDDQGAMVKIASELGADVLVRGQALIQDERAHGGYRCNVNMSVRAVRVSNAILLGNITENYIGRKRTLRDTPISIFGFTVKKVGRISGKQIRLAMMKKWAFEQQNRIVVELVLHEADFDHVDILREWLEEQEWCKSLGEARTKENVTRMQITAKLSQATEIKSKISRGWRKKTCPVKIKWGEGDVKRIEGKIVKVREED